MFTFKFGVGAPDIMAAAPAPSSLPVIDLTDMSNTASSSSSFDSPPAKKRSPNHAWLENTVKRRRNHPGSGAGRGLEVAKGSKEKRDLEAAVLDMSREEYNLMTGSSSSEADPDASELVAVARERRFASFSTIAEGEDEFAEIASAFAKDELRVPPITKIDINRASQPLMDVLQAEAEAHEMKHGLDDKGNLNMPGKFNTQTPSFEPRGVIKHFPIYNLVVSTLLDPYDKVQVWTNGLKKMQELVNSKTRGFCSYLLFLYSIGLVSMLQLLSDDLDTIICVGRIASQRHNLMNFVKVRKQMVVYTAFKTGRTIKAGMSGLVQAIGTSSMTFLCA